MVTESYISRCQKHRHPGPYSRYRAERRQCHLTYSPQAERIRRDPVAYLNGGLRKLMISKISPDRSKIIIEQDDHVKYWTRHFGVTKDELTRAIERVGNSAAAVRKQLSAPRPAAT